MEIPLEDYARRFTRLKTAGGRTTFPAHTFHRAPYKPILLLSVLDLFDSGAVTSNFIEPSEDLLDVFTRYKERVLPGYSYGSIALPYSRLSRDGFWHLDLIPGAAGQIEKMTSLTRLREEVLGAHLDAELYALMQSKENRAHLRSILIQTYFASEARHLLVEQGAINRGAFVYSEDLLSNPKDSSVRETLTVEEAYRPAIRNQGFRRAVVKAYEHRCATCGIRVRTPDGHTVVAAAHIVPWSQSHDDRPSNGMALCQTCHWTFDEGLMRVSTEYEVRASVHLNLASNSSGHLANLEGRGIVRPRERAYWPDPVSLEWHHQHVFRRG